MSNDDAPRAQRLALQSLLAVALVLALTLSGLRSESPPPAGLDATAEAFSALRAFETVEAIAQAPHPVGSTEHQRVRDELLRRLAALGLGDEVEIQKATGVHASSRLAAEVENLLVRIPGSRSQGIVAVAAHYDSGAQSPGAADDGSSVAAILETIRALLQTAPLANDLLFILSDGEERGLLGAEAFASEHPWMREVEVLLNFDARGASGPSALFETTRGNQKLIAAVADTLPHPVGTSLFYEIYRRLPNSTDMTAFKQGGEFSGLNFAYIGDHTHYHAPIDTPENLNLTTLQHQGENMLELARFFGNAEDLASFRAEQDAVYFSLPFLGFLHYSETWAAWILAGSATIFATILLWARRSAAFGIGALVAGAAASLGAATLVAFAASVAWGCIVALTPGFSFLVLMKNDVYNNGPYLAAFALGSIGLALGIFSGLARRLHARTLSFGAMALLLFLQLACVLWLPGATYLFLLPFALASAAQVADFVANEKLSALGAALALGIFGAWFAPHFVSATEALSFRSAALPTALLSLCLAAFARPLEELGKGIPLAAISLLAALLALALGSSRAHFDAEEPRPNSLVYAITLHRDKASEAQWLSMDPEADSWTRHFLGEQPRQQAQSKIRIWAPYPSLAAEVAQPWDDVSAARVEAAVDPSDPRTVQLAISGDAGVNEIHVFQRKGAAPKALRVNGRRLAPSPPRNNPRFPQGKLASFFGSAFELELRFEDSEAASDFELEIIAVHPGLAEALVGKAARPPDTMPRGIRVNDAVVVIQSWQAGL